MGIGVGVNGVDGWNWKHVRRFVRNVMRCVELLLRLQLCFVVMLMLLLGLSLEACGLVTLVEIKRSGVEVFCCTPSV